MLGVDLDHLPEEFVSHPLGLMVDEEPCVRSPQRLDGDAEVFCCAVSEGMELEVLDATDLIAELLEAISGVRRPGAGQL